MVKTEENRRDFMKSVAGVAVATVGSTAIFASQSGARGQVMTTAQTGKAQPPIHFAAIGINHSHIYGMVDAIIRGGGALVSFYAHLLHPVLAVVWAKKPAKRAIGPIMARY